MAMSEGPSSCALDFFPLFFLGLRMPQAATVLPRALLLLLLPVCRYFFGCCYCHRTNSPDESSRT